jgi:hypothetical protein
MVFNHIIGKANLMQINYIIVIIIIIHRLNNATI